MSVNKVILIGNLGSDPEDRYLDAHRVVANVRLATTEYYKNAQGEKISQTEWHNLEMWDELAHFAKKYLKKGQEIYVEGKIRYDYWQDKEGNQRMTTRIRVTHINLLRGTVKEDMPAEQAVKSEPSDNGDDFFTNLVNFGN